jgi:uncharacterized protein YcbX
MAGVSTDSAHLGWHGLDGDRRYGFRRVGDNGGFPWLSASRLPELLLYVPVGADESGGEPLPTHVRTPSGARLELEGAELRDELAHRFGGDLELMKLKHGIFDEAAVSIISPSTIAGIARQAGLELDRRRFRANVVVETESTDVFVEDAWVGRRLTFGDGERPATVSVTARDVRCVMINLDPDTGERDARALKTVVRINENNAGVYGTVVQRGTIRAGDPVYLLDEQG